MNKFIGIGLILVFLGGAVFGFGFRNSFVPETAPRPYQVTDKDEFGGRCYVQTWIEVTPEDYIGLEVGDEFEVRE